MNADFLAVLDFWEREKGISRDVLVTAVQDSLLAAAKKAVGPARQLRVEIDSKSGDIRAYAKLVVSEKVTNRQEQISVFDARRVKADSVVGEEVEVEVTPAGFGRIASQYAKQSLLQHIRRAEKALIFEEFRDRVGEIVSGKVRRFERSDVVIDLGRYEALLPHRERVPTEEYQIGDQVRCFVKAVENTMHGPEIILSRAAPEFVIKLFKVEVSEIADGTIEIRKIAREPGFRTKMAVYTRDPKVDPVGACVGLRGQRVKNIVRELNNEKVDIIPWAADVKTFVSNALSPVQARSFEIDEARKRIRVLVPEDQLSLAIGKRGQNARLTTKLTGWQVDIEAEAAPTTNFDNKVAEAITALSAIEGLSPAIAEVLVRSGFHAFEDLQEVGAEDLAEIPEIGEQAAAIYQSVQAETERRRSASTTA